MRRFHSWLALVISVAVLSSVLPSKSNAYVVLFDQYGNYRSWKKSTVQWALAGNGSKDLSMDKLKAAVGAAFDAWQEVPCSELNFTFAGVVNANPNKDIFIRWWEDSWYPEAQDAAGLTTNWSIGPNGPKKVEIFFNGVSFTWATSGTDDPFSNATDVQAVTTHEIGHAIGLDHPRHRTSTMFFSLFPGQSEAQRSLEADDQRAACFLYPTVNFKDGQACDACWQNSQCPGGVCLDYGGSEGDYCTKECSSNSPCPTGFSCYNVSGVSKPQCVSDNEHCAPIGGNINIGDYCYDHATCKSGRCMPLPDSATCTMECNPNSGANGGCPSDMMCLGGKTGKGICYPKGDGQLGDSCLSPANCASFDCIGVGSGQGVCTNPCTGPSQCQSGYKCVIGFCLKSGSGDFGDSCNTMSDCESAYCAPVYQYCTNACEIDSACPSGSQCLAIGFCNAGATGEVGEVCGLGDGAKKCKDDLFCFYQAAGATTGLCMEGCDARFDSGCSGNLYCQWYYQDWAKKVVGVCVHDNGGAGEGVPCGGTSICKPHLICANTDGLGPKCRKDCNAKNFLGCKGGAACIPLNLADNPKLGACHPKDEAPAVENPRVVETKVADDPVQPDPELSGGIDGNATTGTGGSTDGTNTGMGTGEVGTDGGSSGSSGGGPSSGGCRSVSGQSAGQTGTLLLLMLLGYLIGGLRRESSQLELLS